MRYLKVIFTALLFGFSVAAFAANTDTSTTTSSTTDNSQTSVTAPSATDATQTSTSQATPAQKLKMLKMTCEQFTAIDESFKPKVIYWAIGHMKGKKSSEGVVDVEGVDRIVPVVIDECKQNPKQSFWKTLKEKAKDIL